MNYPYLWAKISHFLIPSYWTVSSFCSLTRYLINWSLYSAKREFKILQYHFALDFPAIGIYDIIIDSIPSSKYDPKEHQ